MDTYSRLHTEHIAPACHQELLRETEFYVANSDSDLTGVNPV
ncbi:MULTISPECIES: hypothetical protein [unclassified Oleiphilus]|jgi:hypothetical protein|nr:MULTISPECIES: hypothetical protein [unclassified Oleiphilus]